MERFAAVFSKLRSACDQSLRDATCRPGDLSPRCAPEAVRWFGAPSTPGVLPGGLGR
jgi:hypothetical protein